MGPNNRFLTFFYTCVITASIFSITPISGNGAFEEFLKKLFQSYDKNIRPNHGGQSVEVGITMYVMAVTDINEKDMTLTCTMYFRQHWNDPRLAYALPIPGSDNLSSVSLQGDKIRNIWVPDTFIVNEVNSFQHDTFVLNELVKIKPNGDILMSGRYTVTVNCPMNLAYYPFDHQVCLLDIESYGGTMTDIRYSWAKNMSSVGISPDVSTPTHSILAHRLKDSSVSLTTGNYSRVGVELVIERYSGRFVLRFFLPMFLFVLLSLLSLWVTDGKMAVLLNFLNICFINLFMGERSSDAGVISHHTTIDTYFTISAIHVTLCLLYSFIANFLGNPARGNESMEMITPRHSTVSNDDAENLVGRSHPRPVTAFKYQNMCSTFFKTALLISFVLSNLGFIINCSLAPIVSLDQFIRVGY